MTAFIILSLTIILVYAFIIAGYYLSWKNYPLFTNNNSKEDMNVFVSVVIPVRNESKNIRFLLNDLLNQTCKKEAFEILLVNDHSEDNTIELAQNCKLNNLIIINLKENEFGKKQAIKAGVTSAKGELIVTLDGDCRVNSGWLSTITSFYATKKPELIICPVIYSGEKTLFDYMQSLEVAALVASGAGAAIRKKATMCNGANLAFSKKLYIRSLSALQSNVPSGDDIFLLHAAKKSSPDKISFLKSYDVAVYAKPANTFNSFYKQRKRWSSKWVHYKDKDVIQIAFLVFFTNIIICIYFIAGFFNLSCIILFFAALAIKSVADMLLLNSFTAFFVKKDIMRYFWLTQLVYPFYIVVTAVLSNVGKIEWKKRIY